MSLNHLTGRDRDKHGSLTLSFGSEVKARFITAIVKF